MGRTVLGKMVKGDVFREVAFVETPEMEGNGPYSSLDWWV